MAHIRTVDGVGIDDIDEVSEIQVLQPGARSRKQVAPDLMPVQEPPVGETAYDFSGKDV